MDVMAATLYYLQSEDREVLEDPSRFLEAMWILFEAGIPVEHDNGTIRIGKGLAPVYFERTGTGPIRTVVE